MSRSPVLLLVVVILLGVSTADAAAQMTRSTLSTDSTEIVYEAMGEGSPALVFVHCWACNRSFWKEQLQAFATEHKVVAMDLAGHGASGRDRETWTVDSLADDVVAVVGAEKLDRAILVGHSMGGPVSLRAAARLPEVVGGVILVDTVQNAEFEIDTEMSNQMMMAFEKDYEGTMRQMAAVLFPPDSPAGVQEFVVDGALEADHDAVIALMRDFVNVDQAEWLAAVEVPVRAVNAEPLPPWGQDTEIEINRKYADFDAELIGGVGHYLQLEKPEAVNAALRRWIDEMAKD